MARVQIDLPERFVYATDLAVRIGDLNYGNHLGNDRVLSLFQEGRAGFLAGYGWTELRVCGLGLIQADTAVVYKSEAFYGEVLRVELALAEFHKYGFDFVGRLAERSANREVARIKAGMLFFDYTARRVQRIPQEFLSRIGDGTVQV